ncbi:hypothetical protein [Paenibacillus alvei]|uniref:Uncharacterized protein n=1 Tax=Paenibacillus alvei TaxID=44250 RepID=A0A383RA54_PAEAL|nr:hypothetical protein [Paenibacillus alvei]SYX83995.1 protein of unknown function [Paenibacillus alvei]
MKLADPKQDIPQQFGEKNCPVHVSKGLLSKAGFIGERDRHLNHKKFICTVTMQSTLSTKELTGVGLKCTSYPDSKDK